MYISQRERDYLRKILSERDSQVEDHRGTGQDGLPSVVDVQAKLTDKECELRKLAEEYQELKEKLAQAEAQVHVHVSTPNTCICTIFHCLWYM